MVAQISPFSLDLSALSRCTALRRLSLVLAVVASLEALTHCPSLEYIALSSISFHAGGEPAAESGDGVPYHHYNHTASNGPCRSLLRDILRAGPATLPALRDVHFSFVAVAADAASQPGSPRWRMWMRWRSSC